MTNLLKKLNPAQKKAVLHNSGPALVLAGAGSGKTTVLTHRAAYLILEKKVDPSSILLVTFTNKAAGEMKERIEMLAGSAVPFAGTFHSLCAKILRRDGFQIGLDQNYVIYDSDDQLSLIKQIYKDHQFDLKKFKPSQVKNSISAAKNDLLMPNEYQELTLGEYQNFVAKVYWLYQRALTQAQAVDFDDLLNKTVQLLRTKPEVTAKYQQQFEHVLVDEYQDTNKAQYQLSQILSMPQNNLYVVGDFSQSIYAWRGADYRNMLQLKTDYPKIKEYRLEQNYRSTQTILDAATQIISHNTTHPILKLWTNIEAANQIICLDNQTGELEAAKVVNFIKSQKDSVPLKEMAILYRTNAQSRLFEEALIRQGIPYRLVGGTKFYERKEIKDALAYIRIIVNPADTVSYARATKLGKRRLAKLEKWRDENGNQDWTLANPQQLLKKALDLTDYRALYSEQVEEERQRLENLVELEAMAGQFEKVTQFLENVALLQDNYYVDINNPIGGNDNAVQLMSLHSAKGLEFSIVFMVGMEDGLLPHSHSMLNQDDIEEERRLCYVGITRAKQLLFFSYARTRYQYGSHTSSVPSRFLHDISGELLHYDSESANLDQNSKPQSEVRRLVMDDEFLDDVLSGEIDLEVFMDR